MKRFVISAALVALAIPAMARTRNVSISVEDGENVTGCDQVVVRFDTGRGYRAEENLAVSGVRSLKVSAARNGGIYVSSGTGYSVKACKAAEVEGTLRDLQTNVRGNEVTADGPEESDWVVYFLVTVPGNASVDLDSTNGPISIREVAGTVTARAKNGPISAKNSSGTIDLSTQNGPIALSGGSGNVKLNAENGPISVKLEDTVWNGNLDARTQNGPLSVKVPHNFRSGTKIESDGRGPVSCRGDVCQYAKRSWDEDESRTIEFGSGPTVVHMSTVNGPISVKAN